MNMISVIAASRRRGVPINLTSGLAHWWDLAASAATETDLAGSVNVPRQGTVTTSASGAPDGGSCVDLGDGSGYYLTSVIADLVDYASDWSANIWSNVSSYSSTGNWIMNQRENADARKFQIRHNTNDSAVTIIRDGAFVSATASSPGTASWRMTSLVVRGGNIEHWANGSLIESIAFTGSTETGSARFALGAASFADVNVNLRHRGLLFAAGMWSRALSSSEISALYNSGSGRRYASL